MMTYTTNKATAIDLRKDFTAGLGRKLMIGAAAAMLLVSATGCSNMNKQEQRTLSGGALGAAAGGAIGLLTGSWVTGAVIGGAGGAAAGALTSDKQVKLD
ncbi:glycine zipper domain-containing protein [Oceanibaculum pacificum]|nr:glycine zipper domain-containing protein [Oceanibaculum pacificum]